MPSLELVSHHLCPYVQRAATVLLEKDALFSQIYVDLGNKPDWFKAISPLGKVPLLRIDDKHVLFESAVICEYLDETVPGPRLHPEDSIERAQHRAWIEFASATLNDIWGLYSAPDWAAFEKRRNDIAGKMGWLESAIGDGPYFSGQRFSLVDIAFAPVFRYFDVFESFVELGVFDEKPKLRAWRKALSERPSAVAAASQDYADRLRVFLKARASHLSRLMP
jgi:glutathione S-transferase